MTVLVRPFAALRPRAEHAIDVIAPPYDVVSTEEARALAHDQPNSFLHVSRPEIDMPTDTSPYSDEAYARGAQNFEALRETVLVRDLRPSYYVYRMSVGGREQTGVACVAAVSEYEANRVRKHELTRPDKENDRVRNIATLNAQTGPVLCAYRANDTLRALLRASAADTPTLQAPGPNDVLHTVWRVDDEARVAQFSTALNTLDALYIADGHHRAAAAARVARQRRVDGASDASHESFLVVAFPHDEMRILDYNRVVRDTRGLPAADLLARIGDAFDIEPSRVPVAPESPESFGMYLAGGWYRLRIHAALVPRADPVARLDVSLLQDHVLAPILNIGDPRTDPRIDFVGGVRGLRELERRVADGAAAAAFSLHPTGMDQLMAVADAGRLMPPKSTWFEPKLADGLLSHVLD